MDNFDALIDEQYKFLKSETSQEATSVSFKEAVCGPRYRKATWIGVGLFTAQQTTGINGVVPYTLRLLVLIADKSNGQFPITPKAGAYICAFMQGFAALLAFFPLGHFGRKTILMTGQLGMSISFLVCGIGIVMEWYTITFICLLLFIFFFQST